MTEAVLATLIAPVLIASGLATRYDPGVMQATVANRIMWGQLPEDTDPTRCVALMDCDRIGSEVWLEYGWTVAGPFVVADCAAKQDRERLTQLHFAVDLSYELAKELQLPWPDVRVWDAKPYETPGDNGNRREKIGDPYPKTYEQAGRIGDLILSRLWAGLPY